MDIQFWIYVAIVVLSILAQARRKKRQQEELEREKQADGEVNPQPKPLSFEDLLREIQQTRNPPPPQPASRQADEWENYETVESEERSLEREEAVLKPQPVYNNTVEIYERAKAEAFNRASLEESMKVEDTDVRFGKFKVYEKAVENQPARAFAESFRDFDQFKKAFVMAEVLKPRF